MAVRQKYLLYDNKAGIGDDGESSLRKLRAQTSDRPLVGGEEAHRKQLVKAHAAAGGRKRVQIHGQPRRKRQQRMKPEKRVAVDLLLQAAVEGQVVDIQQQIAGTRYLGAGLFHLEQRQVTKRNISVLRPAPFDKAFKAARGLRVGDADVGVARQKQIEAAVGAQAFVQHRFLLRRGQAAAVGEIGAHSRIGKRIRLLRLPFGHKAVVHRSPSFPSQAFENGEQHAVFDAGHTHGGQLARAQTGAPHDAL
mgnify:CR=1 FL=1